MLNYQRVLIATLGIAAKSYAVNYTSLFVTTLHLPCPPVQSSFFSIAVRSFVREMFDDFVIMCSSCSRYSDQEPLSKHLRVILALTKFAISRSRSVMLNTDVSREAIRTSQELLCSAKIYVQMTTSSDEESKAVF